MPFRPCEVPRLSLPVLTAVWCSTEDGPKRTLSSKKEVANRNPMERKEKRERACQFAKAHASGWKLWIGIAAVYVGNWAASLLQRLLGSVGRADFTIHAAPKPPAQQQQPDPERSCYRKKRYLNEVLARQVARHAGIKRNVDLRVYGCELCGGYHITKSLHAYGQN